MNKSIILRISEDDYKKIKEEAKKLGLNISSFVRMAAIKEVKNTNN